MTKYSLTLHQYIKVGLYLGLISLFWLIVTPVQAATLSLHTTDESVVVGQLTTVDIVLDPASDLIVGTDIFLIYDPQSLEVVSIGNSGALPNMPAHVIDNDQGLLKVSLANPVSQYLTSSKTIATITLKGLTEAAQTPLTFDFTRGLTTDTNVVVAGGTDVLERVRGIDLEIAPITSANTSNTGSDTSTTSNTDQSTTGTSAVETQYRSTSAPAFSPPLPAGFVSPLPNQTTEAAYIPKAQTDDRERVLGKASDKAKVVVPAALESLNEATRSRTSWPLVLFGALLGLSASILARWIWLYGIPTFGIRKGLRRLWKAIPVRIIVTRNGVMSVPESEPLILSQTNSTQPTRQESMISPPPPPPQSSIHEVLVRY